MMRARLAAAAVLVATSGVAWAEPPRAEALAVGGVTVGFSVPAAATAVPSDALPRLEKELASVPGAKISAQRGFARSGDHGESMLVTCISAPADDWTPEFEPTLFDKVGDAMKSELSKRARWDSFVVSPAVGDGLVQYAPVGGEGSRETAAAGERAYADGRVALAFYEDGGPKALVCVALCEETAQAAARACPPLGKSLRLSGAIVQPPQPSVAARTLAAVARRPLSGVGVLVGLALMAIGVVVLARKPS